MRDKMQISIVEKREPLVVGALGAESGLAVPESGSFLEYQLRRRGFDPETASSIASEYLDVETFGELVGRME